MSGTVTLQTVAGALGAVTVSLPAETGTACTTGSVCSGYQASGPYLTTVDLAADVGATILPLANGGTARDSSADVDSLFGLNAGTSTEIDTEGELEIALNDLDVVTVTTDDVSSANLITLISDETGSGLVVFNADPLFATQIRLPMVATPVTDADGEMTMDIDGWGTGFDAIEIWNGTASAYVVATTASDTPTNGQVPKWNTGGSITWEADTDTSLTTVDLAADVGATILPLANGGTARDSSSDVDALFGLNAGVSTDIDTESELEIALNDLNLVTVTTDDVSSANLITLISDETGAGLVVFNDDPLFATQIRLPMVATPVTDADGEMTMDIDGWGTGFDAIEIWNGTASAYVVATTASDTPTNGQVPKWNTGGAITWEADTDTGLTTVDLAADVGATILPLANGGTARDSSSDVDALFGMNAGVSADIDTEAELEIALNDLDLVAVSTDDISSANLITILSDETGSGLAVFATDPTIDIGGGSLEIPNSATLPGTCDIGEVYIDTDVTDNDKRFFVCTAANVWTNQIGALGTECTELDAAGALCNTTAGCTSSTRVSTGTPVFDRTVLTFADADGAASFNWTAPLNLVNGTAQVKFSWGSASASCNAGSPADDVCWTVASRGIANDENYWDGSFSASEVGKSDNCTDDLDLMKSTAVTLTHGATAGEMITLVVRRDHDESVGSCNDDAAFAVELYSIELCYDVNSIHSGGD